MKANAAGKIRIGVGGWTYEPWRGAFFPKGLPHAKELAYAGSKLTSIEINGTYYGSQKPASFIKWRDETPDDFVFAVKGPRFATNRRVLGEAGELIERFFKSGVTELKSKLGPINWQFATTKRFDADDFAAFLKTAPQVGRRPRHPPRRGSAPRELQKPEFIALAREHGVAVMMAGRLRLSADRRRDRAIRLRAHHGNDRKGRERLFRQRRSINGRAARKHGPRAARQKISQPSRRRRNPTPRAARCFSMSSAATRSETRPLRWR